MASTYSTNLAIELIGTGEQSGTWGTTTNTNLGTLIEQSISGYVTQAITDGSGANTTITIPNGATGVARNMVIEMTGALTFSTTSLIVPANKKLYFIYNNTTGGFAVTVKVSGLTGVLVPNGKKVILTSNGTDIVEAANQVVGNFAVGGTATMAAINASGLVAMAGAATVGTTLVVSGVATFNVGPSISGTLAITNTANTMLDALTVLNASAGNAASTRISLGNNTSAGAGQIILYGGNHATLPNYMDVTNANNALLRFQTGGGAASFGGTLGVTGTSTMAAINASDVMTISKTNSLANLTLQTAALADGYASLALKNLGGSGIVAISRSAGGDIFTGSTQYALNVGTLNAFPLMLGTNGVTRLTIDSAGASTFTKGAAGDVLILTNGGATPKPMYFYSDASTMSMGTSASQGGSLLAFVSTTSAQINISGGSVQSWTTAGTNVTGTLGATGIIGSANSVESTGQLQVYAANKIAMSQESASNSTLTAHGTNSSTYGNLNLRVAYSNGTPLTIATISSTGLAVTGTILSSGTSATARINPATDNVGYVGESTSRWQAIYAVNGTIQTSDGREKNAIEDSNLGLSFVQSLRPVSYKWNTGENIVTYDENKNMVVTPRAGVRLHYGFIAQDVQAAIPEGVDFGGFVQEPDNGTMSLRYHEFIGPMVKAIQELAADFDAYKSSHP
jgi:hypothetical protein